MLTNMMQARTIFEAYLKKHPGEAEGLRHLADLFENYLPLHWIDRKNFTGHLTASAFVIDPPGGQVLLIFHKLLQRWLQPGGHVEVGDQSPLQAARREVQEEMGIPAGQLTVVGDGENAEVPFNIDSHWIPENAAKNEPGHYHHDFRYLLRVNGLAELSAQVEEIDGYRWVPIAELPEDPDFQRVIGKVRGYHTPNRFFQAAS